MKKAVLLSDGDLSMMARVYTDRVVSRLSSLTALHPLWINKSRALSGEFSDAEIIFSSWGMPHFTGDEIAEFFPNVKYVYYAAGSVQGFAREFLSRGARVFSAWGANAVPVIEYAVSQVILANKGYFTASRLCSGSLGGRRAASEAFATFPGNYGTRVGVLGLGMIGRQVASRLAKEYSLEVLGYDPYFPPEAASELGIRLASLDEIFSTCQTITNHIANVPATVGMLGYGLFSEMLPNAVFINTGRGAQIVEPDLIRALTEAPTRTAVLDVTMPEPPERGSEFYSLENVVLTPHIAGSSGSEVARMAEYMADELSRVESGKAPKWEVTEKMLSTMA